MELELLAEARLAELGRDRCRLAHAPTRKHSARPAQPAQHASSHRPAAVEEGPEAA
jgi:hypothetical protein